MCRHNHFFSSNSAQSIIFLSYPLQNKPLNVAFCYCNNRIYQIKRQARLLLLPFLPVLIQNIAPVFKLCHSDPSSCIWILAKNSLKSFLFFSRATGSLTTFIQTFKRSLVVSREAIFCLSSPVSLEMPCASLTLFTHSSYSSIS